MRGEKKKHARKGIISAGALMTKHILTYTFVAMPKRIAMHWGNNYLDVYSTKLYLKVIFGFRFLYYAVGSTLKTH